MARYADAIRWIISNDDTEWLDADASTAMGTESVTACLVADLFDKTEPEVRRDLLAEQRRQQRTGG